MGDLLWWIVAVGLLLTGLAWLADKHLTQAMQWKAFWNYDEDFPRGYQRTKWQQFQHRRAERKARTRRISYPRYSNRV